MNKISPIAFIFMALLCLPASAQDLPADKSATRETVNLYRNLKKVLSKGILFGHQDALAYGYGWKYEKGRSDIKDVTGDYPAVYGWELGHLEIDRPTNLDGVPFDKMKQLIGEGYQRGGVITISWHLNNPLTGKTAWNPEPGTVAAVLPGGQKHDLYKTWLDKLAAFMLDLKGSRGEYIPVVFRPFHELNGSWFWWGRNHCTPEAFKQLWQFTVGYLRDEKKLRHLLYAFNTDKFYSKEEYLSRYPGDDWVDVIGFDIYQRGANDAFMKEFSTMLSLLTTIAAERKKIPALTEFGYGSLPDSTWWTGTFGKVLADHKIAWALAWRNAGPRPNGGAEFYVPYKGQASAADFRKFYAWKQMLFQKDIAKEKIYR